MLQSDSLKLPLCHGDSESQFKTMKYQPDYPDAFSQLNTLACGARTMWLGITFRTITLESRALCHRKYLALFRIVWKGGHAGVLFKKGLAGRSVNFPVVRKMMLVRLRSDWNPRALTMAA